MDSNAILFFSYTLIFWILSYLIIRKSRSPANILFSSSTFFYGVGTLFSGLGWGPFATIDQSFKIFNNLFVINQLTFFAIAASFIVIAPLGIFYSGRAILYGTSGYRDELAYILLIVFIVIAIFNFMIYSSLSLKDNFMFEDILTLFILILAMIIYFTLYKQIADYRLNFIFILLGFGIGIISLMISTSLFILNYTSTAEIVRSMGPFIAVFVVLISFTNLPQSFRNKPVSNN